VSNQEESLWLETCGDDLTPRPSLPGDRTADVAIVGAGFTGLWAAHHLLRHDPSLRVVVLEREVAGWGASGRNGGWCSALFPVSWSRLAARYGDDAARRMRDTLRDTVAGIGTWCASQDVDFVQGGTLTVARGAAQVARLRGAADWLTGDMVSERVRVRDADGGIFDPDCAAIHPAKLVRRLARLVETQGAVIFEGTGVLRIAPGQVLTTSGTVRAEVVLRATEGYTCELPGLRRALAPVRSLVIATEPLPAEVWQEIGWQGRETLGDERHLIIYAQRTRDDRIVLGGRGAPYRFGSKTRGDAGYGRTHAALERVLHELFPVTRGARITHRWGGVLGVPRDWMPSVGLDVGSGIGWAGGYVGDGVACAALAGRTLADLVLRRDTDRSRLPWVGHRSRLWEPEPLRWLGIQAMTALMASADHAEQRTGRPAKRAALLERVI
jgi:glycine/D-amino acid oxidase-like deaminating enzyme